MRARTVGLCSSRPVRGWLPRRGASRCSVRSSAQACALAVIAFAPPAQDLAAHVYRASLVRRRRPALGQLLVHGHLPAGQLQRACPCALGADRRYRAHGGVYLGRRRAVRRHRHARVGARRALALAGVRVRGGAAPAPGRRRLRRRHSIPPRHPGRAAAGPPRYRARLRGADAEREPARVPLPARERCRDCARGARRVAHDQRSSDAVSECSPGSRQACWCSCSPPLASTRSSCGT